MLVFFIHADVTANVCVGCPKIVTVCVQARNFQRSRNWAVPFSVVDVIFCQSFELPTFFISNILISNQNNTYPIS